MDFWRGLLVTMPTRFLGTLFGGEEITSMLIEEVIRTCAVGPVAEAAVASVGGGFAASVQRAASASGMSIGDYAVTRVETFARNGRENEMRAVASAMAGSQVPVLAGLERILRLDPATSLRALTSTTDSSSSRSLL